MKKNLCPCAQATKRNKELTTSFIYKVLITLHSFQEDPALRDGAKVSDILERINQSFSIDGDCESQVKTAIEQGVSFGFIWKKDNCKYQILANSAAIQHTPSHSNTRKRKINEICKIFTREIPATEDNGCKCTSRESSVGRQLTPDDACKNKSNRHQYNNRSCSKESDSHGSPKRKKKEEDTCEKKNQKTTRTSKERSPCQSRHRNKHKK
ncbi:hypothetical protein FQR65_LT01096 [Abscondita terminalis]|nr:hypothetical protein FQR65_LT01096 [Abscondita terminalis]